MVENARSESSSCGIVRRNLHAKTERCTLRARTHMAVCTLVCGCVMHLWRHVSCNKYGLRLSQFVLIRDQLNAAFVSDILFEDTSVIIRLYTAINFALFSSRILLGRRARVHSSDSSEYHCARHVNRFE